MFQFIKKFKIAILAFFAAVLVALVGCSKTETPTPQPTETQPTRDTVFVSAGFQNGLFCYTVVDFGESDNGELHFVDTTSMIEIQVTSLDTMAYLEIYKQGSNNSIVVPIMAESSPLFMVLPAKSAFLLTSATGQRGAGFKLHSCTRP